MKLLTPKNMKCGKALNTKTFHFYYKLLKPHMYATASKLILLTALTKDFK